MDSRAALALQQASQTVRIWLKAHKLDPKVRAAMTMLADHGDSDWQSTVPTAEQEAWACRWHVRFPEGNTTSCTGPTVKEVWREGSVCRPQMDRGERLRLDIQRATIEVARLPVLGQCVEQERVLEILTGLVPASQPPT